MKKLTVSIGNLGSAATGDYVSFNIWQGGQLLVGDKTDNNVNALISLALAGVFIACKYM
ncbi:hypothetical protein [Morganella morganii]|uniref:hypothetical protein n=1 Tax=Morganella morganii TaxID=582 RepID=UPI0015E83EE8|nr:hypothetical protein [Morganella morganii]HEI8861031.1 hypothetical protein [Morganella morganii]